MDSILTTEQARRALPDAPSDLLEVALNDLIKAERRARVRIDRELYTLVTKD